MPSSERAESTENNQQIGDKDHYCDDQRCKLDGDLHLYLPEWGETRVVCRGFLRRLHPEVDAKTWLEAGYATWKPADPSTLPYSTDALRDGERIRKREILDETMGWSDE